jgi:hypothetical protein
MTGVSDVVALLYRADWTTLSLSAEVHTTTDRRLWMKSIVAAMPPWLPVPADGPELPDPGTTSQSLTLLIAPGRRYRAEGEDSADAFGSDGEQDWERPARARFNVGGLAGTSGHLDAPWPGLFCPARLLTFFVLDVQGPVTACGRDGVRIVATPRPSLHDPTMRGHLRLDRIEAIVDAELGILLYRQDIFQGQVVSLTELISVTLDPPEAADESRFRPPPGSVIVESPGQQMREFFDQPGWRVANTAAGLAASALGPLVRHSPFVPWSSPVPGHDPEPGLPADEPEPPDPSPVSDDLLYLLYKSGAEAPELTGTLHQWCDVTAMVSRAPDSAREIGHGGLGRLLDAAGERISRTHTAATVRTGGLGRYRVDYVLHPGKHPSKAIACDGQRRWVLYQDRLTTGAAAAPPPEVASLVDASWLLKCHLSGGAEVTIGSRRGYRISIATGVSPAQWMVFFPAEAVVDAELGVLLRLTCYIDGQPAARGELRDISTEPIEASAFRIEPSPGMRTFEADNLLDEMVAEVPGPVGLAARTAVDVAKRTGNAVTAARSFLDNLRRQLVDRGAGVAPDELLPRRLVVWVGLRMSA